MITGKIIAIKPEAQYQGDVFTQSVLVRISEDTEIELFDGTVPIASDDLVNEETEIHITAHPKSVEVIDETTPKISRSGDGTHRIVGTVKEMSRGDDNNPSSAIIDIRGETIDLELSDLIEPPQMELGNTLFISAYRLDLSDIKGAGE